MPPPVQYAKSGDLFIAYEVTGEGPVDLIWAPGSTSHLAELPEFKAGNVVECKTTFIRNPVTTATSHPRIVLPEGLILKDAALLASKRFVVRDGVKYDHSGQYAAFGFFAYTGP